MKVSVVCAIAAVVLTACGEPSPEEKEKSHKSDVIAQCRKEQNDDLQERSTRRFIRGVCDKMEVEYRDKYGSAP